MARTLFKDYGNRETQRPQEEVKQTMRDITQQYLEEMEQDSILFQKIAVRSIPALSHCEVEVNKRIGMGEFGVILEVTNISLQDSSETQAEDGASQAVVAPQDDTTSQQKPLHHFHSKSCGALPLFEWQAEATKSRQEVPPDNELLRQRLATKVLRECDSNAACGIPQRGTTASSSDQHHRRTFLRPRFAVKQIRKDLYPRKKVEAGKDLAKEAKLLSRLEHPNVIRLRATIGRPGDENFMLMLDLLGTNLSEHVLQWQQRIDETSGGLVFPWNLSAANQRKEVERKVLSERLLALYDVARAMQYLHQKSILVRDLKTENVASNHHGAFQLLDFGLAKELKVKDRVKNMHGDTVSQDGTFTTAEAASLEQSNSEQFDDMYRLTGLTGTVRIMSPEVLQCRPYGLSADVYSYGIVVWEVFQGERNHLSAPEVIKGERPEVPVLGMPPRIESLIKKCFGSPAFRPTFAMLSQELEYQLLEFQQEEWHADYTHYRYCTHREGKNDDSFQHVYFDHHANIFHRFDYLRQLSVQSLVTATNTTSSVAAVEN